MVDFYGTVNGAKAYWTLRGMAVDLDVDDEEITADLVVASEWLDGRYRSSFPGEKVGMRAQLREWPRTSAYDIYNYLVPSDSVPYEVVNATYEAAYKHRQAPGALSVDYTPSKYKSVSVDGAVSATFASFGGAGEVQTQFAAIDAILSGLLGSANGGGGSSLSGAVSRI